MLTTEQYRMGKTIQIIALFVSDRQKPNLVIAYVPYRLMFHRTSAKTRSQAYCRNHAMEKRNRGSY